MIALVVVAWLHGIPTARTVGHYGLISSCQKAAVMKIATLRNIRGVRADFFCRPVATRLAKLTLINITEV